MPGDPRAELTLNIIVCIIHEAEEGGFWAEVPAIPGAQRKAKPLRNYCKTCTKQSKAAFQSR